MKLKIILFLLIPVTLNAQSLFWGHFSDSTQLAEADTALFHLSPESDIIRDANGVSQWNDISGNNNHFVQIDNTEKPDTVNNVLNGYRGMYFNDDILYSMISSSNENYTNFCVFSVPSAVRKNVIWGADTLDAAFTYQNTEVVWYTRNPTDSKGFRNGNNTSFETFSHDTTLTTVVLTVVKNNNSVDMYFNGAKVISDSLSTYNGGVTSFGIGGRYRILTAPPTGSPVDELIGYIFEIIHYDKVLDDGKVVNTINQLITKYGL